MFPISSSPEDDHSGHTDQNVESLTTGSEPTLLKRDIYMVLPQTSLS